MFNALANLLVRACGVTPRDTVGHAQAPAQLQLLLAQSHEHGVLPDHEHRFLTGALRLEQETLGSLARPMTQTVSISSDATSTDVERVSARTGRSRLVVLDQGRPRGLVHVRDAVQCHAHGTVRPVTELSQRLTTLPAELPLIDAVTTMREQRAQLALVDRDGDLVGLVALEDLLETVLGQFEDDTDPAAD